MKCPKCSKRTESLRKVIRGTYMATCPSCRNEWPVHTTESAKKKYLRIFREKA